MRSSEKERVGKKKGSGETGGKVQNLKKTGTRLSDPERTRIRIQRDRAGGWGKRDQQRSKIRKGKRRKREKLANWGGGGKMEPSSA